MQDVVLHFTVSRNSIPYFRYAAAQSVRLSANPDQVKIYVYCLDLSSYIYLSRKTQYRVFRLEKSRGSIGHARALDFAMSQFLENSVNVLADTDAVIVAKNWDVLLRNVVLKSGIQLFGTQLEGIGGFSSGITLHQQYKKLPSTTWLMFSPNLDTSGLSMIPNKESDVAIVTEVESKIYQLPIGYFLARDTGWQIPQFIHDKDIKHDVLEIVKPSSIKCRVLKETSDYHDEFHYIGEPFLVHQRGSMRHLYRISSLSRDFYQATDRFLKTSENDWKMTQSEFLLISPELIKEKIKASRSILRSIVKQDSKE